MNRKPSVFVVFLTVFIDFIGFGIVMTMLPMYSRKFGASGLEIGLIFASYSAMQFIFSPIWGRLSDRIGRRPVLLLSTAGACVSYVIFALAFGLSSHVATLWWITISRVFAGACAGNVTVAQAYIADITPAEKRSKMMGIIGMAIGLGFVFGPALGGVGALGIGLEGPGWIAAALSASNFILAYAILSESRRPSSEPIRARPHLNQWMHTLSTPRVGLLVVVFSLATFFFSCFESTLPLLVQDNFQLHNFNHAITVGFFLFVYCGLIGAFVQGGATGRLVKKFGEPKLIMMSLVLTGLSLVLMPFVKGAPKFSLGLLFQAAGWPWVKLLFVLALLSVGTSLARPPIFGLLSNLTSEREQGATIGVAQGAGSLARIIGPIFATALYVYIPALPYVICGALALGTGAVALQRLGRPEEAAPAAEPVKLAQ
jgi:MFS family permease